MTLQDIDGYGIDEYDGIDGYDSENSIEGIATYIHKCASIWQDPTSSVKRFSQAKSPLVDPEIKQQTQLTVISNKPEL